MLWKKINWKAVLGAACITLVLGFAAKVGAKIIKSRTVLMEKAKTGNIVEFGSFEQDNDLSNGSEPIKWIVLNKQDGKLLIISKDILDSRNYYEAWQPVTWEQSHLRFWLNSTFYESAFTEEEQRRIQAAELLDSNNPECKADAADHVFLLSIDEARRYFSSDKERKAKKTAYARRGEQPAYPSPDEWWLRSPGSFSNFAASVDKEGAVTSSGHRVDLELPGVRPVLWVSIDR